MSFNKQLKTIDFEIAHLTRKLKALERKKQLIKDEEAEFQKELEEAEENPSIYWISPIKREILKKQKLKKMRRNKYIEEIQIEASGSSESANEWYEQGESNEIYCNYEPFDRINYKDYEDCNYEDYSPNK